MKNGGDPFEREEKKKNEKGTENNTERIDKRMGYSNNAISRKKVFTIEEKLKSYATDNEFSTERHEILWHAWKHNKRWLAQLLEWIMPSFPAYSRHGESHANAILHSIEMILGEEQINKLSASDCFLILHVVYIHDIGMCITHLDRMELMKNKAFISFLHIAQDSSDGMIRKYATLLLKYCEDMPKVSMPQDLLEVKLEVYYAILYMVAEYKRREHGNESAKRLKEWIDTPENLGAGFSTSGIPSRFFYTISACAGVHTSYDFGDVMKLHKVDTGYTHDYMHPRFAAVLLQLGDALDLDNDRFHPLVRQFAGEMPHTSEIHFGKHKSIRRLRVSPEKITIEADCETAEVLRLVNSEYECIKDILKNATYNWSAICPENLSLCLPVLEPIKLLMKGENVQEELVNVKFEIQQEKAFNILQGNNIYRNETFIFLREIFQNAIDASKIQYWTDWKGSRWYPEEKKGDELDISTMGKKLSPISYPIEIELYLAKKEEFDDKYVILEEEQEKKLCEKNGYQETYEYGVLVRVIDHGIGMTAKDIKSISKVGSSYEQRRELVEEMPQWLKPTAEFGIGLQSAFLVSHTITAYTHPRTNEKYKITFQTTGDGGKGEIGVTSLKESDYPRAFGTIFEVFVSNDKKKKNQENLESWRNRDPFEKDYKKKSNIRHAKELQLQLALYLNSLVGEKIFPVKLRMHEFGFENEKENEKESKFRMEITNKMSNIDFSSIYHNEDFQITEDMQIIPCFNAKKIAPVEEKVTWMYQFQEEKDLIIGEIENDFLYAFDCEELKLYLWNYKSNVYARFGAERLQAMRDTMKKSDADEKLSCINIYYKGVYVNTVNWDDDMGLMECLDIKGKLNREYLAINRGEFTEKGYAYVHDELYLSVVAAAHEALEDCDRKVKLVGNNEKKYVLTEKIPERIRGLVREEKSVAKIQSAILSIAGLATYAQNVNAGEVPAPNGNEQCSNWIEVLNKLSEIIKEGKINKEEWTESTFFNLEVFSLQIDKNGKINVGPSKIETCVEIMANIQRYALVSRRNSRNEIWEKYLVRFESLENGETKSGIEEIKSCIVKLKTQWNEMERKNLITSIEDWGENLKRGLKDNVDETVFKISQSKILNQNAIFNWIMKNVPSIAMFSDESSSLRINMLDFQYTNSMYFDINTKWSIYERMIEVYDSTHMRRFSMIAPTGYCQLAFNNNPERVYYVKRGEFSKTGQRYMILPLDGEALKSIYDKFQTWKGNFKKGVLPLEIEFFTKYEKFIHKVVSAINNSETLEFLEESLRAEMQNRHNSEGIQAVTDIEEDFLKKLRDAEKTIGEDECNEVAEIAEEDFWKILKWTMGLEEIESVLLGKIISAYRKMRSREVFLSESERKDYKKLFLGACGLKEKGVEYSGSDSARESMMQLTAYVHKESWLKLPEEQIRNLYERFVCELIDDMERQVKTDFEKKGQFYYLFHGIKKY